MLVSGSGDDSRVYLRGKGADNVVGRIFLFEAFEAPRSNSNHYCGEGR
jgi:hypothetical protein